MIYKSHGPVQRGNPELATVSQQALAGDVQNIAHDLLKVMYCLQHAKSNEASLILTRVQEALTKVAEEIVV